MYANEGGMLGRTALVALVCCAVIVHTAPRNKDDTARDDDAPVPLPGSIKCFKRHEFSGLGGQYAIRTRRNNGSPEECASYCTQIHDDPNESRQCRAFDYNLRNGACKLFERNTETDQNVRLVETGKTFVYELDETCWTNRNTPTRPPHVSSCSGGAKPLMERVTGAYLKASGLAFKSTQNECVKNCVNDQTVTHYNFKCLSISYNEGNQVCVFLNQIARPLDKQGPPLTPDSRYNYYSKMCLASDAVAKCPGYVTRFVGKQLVAMADAKITASNYSSCVGACLTAEAKLGFNCRSGMFYNTKSSDNCILNYSDHYQEHMLFVDSKSDTDYFSLKSCHW